MTNLNKFTSLEDILGKDAEVLTALKTGEFYTAKLGLLPFTAIDQTEYKNAKKDSMKMVPNRTGGMEPDLDEDKLMALVVIAAVHKDQRSTFSFASKALLEKLGVVTAVDVLAKLLAPGEIQNFAIEVQTASGFGPKAQKEVEDDVKNS